MILVEKYNLFMELKRLTTRVEDAEILVVQLKAALPPDSEIEYDELDQMRWISSKNIMEQLQTLLSTDISEKMQKFIDRFDWKDPVTGQPRYGPTMKEKVCMLDDLVQHHQNGLRSIAD
jgi:hypothetical protein